MKVPITIRGRRYTLRSDEDHVDLRKVASYVEERMNEVASRARALDEQTVAILAALNIASDFARFRHQVGQDLQELDRALASTSVLLEPALPPDEDTEEASGRA